MPLLKVAPYQCCVLCSGPGQVELRLSRKALKEVKMCSISVHINWGHDQKWHMLMYTVLCVCTGKSPFSASQFSAGLSLMPVSLGGWNVMSAQLQLVPRAYWSCLLCTYTTQYSVRVQAHGAL